MCITVIIIAQYAPLSSEDDENEWPKHAQHGTSIWKFATERTLSSFAKNVLHVHVGVPRIKQFLRKIFTGNTSARYEPVLPFRGRQTVFRVIKCPTSYMVCRNLADTYVEPLEESIVLPPLSLGYTRMTEFATSRYCGTC